MASEELASRGGEADVSSMFESADRFMFTWRIATRVRETIAVVLAT
jgi:hypothetical protein